MAKQPLPDSLREMVSRDKASLEELAAHIGLSPSELANQYDLGDVTFQPLSGPEAQQEAKEEGQPGTKPA